MARRFYYVCAGLFLLVAAYSIGAHRADAQSGGQFAGISVDGQAGSTTAITSTGDVYARAGVPLCSGPPAGVVWSWTSSCDSNWHYMGNVLGGTIQVDGKTWSGVKDGYRK